jgi:hypothetical protein
MTRKPRKLDEHLVSGKLLTHAYGQMGEIASAAGFFAYFVVMKVYGFPTEILFGLVSQNAYNPSNSIHYNTPYTFNASQNSTANGIFGTAFDQPCNAVNPDGSSYYTAP